MHVSFVLNVSLFTLVVLGGGYVSDALIGITAPGEPCEALLLAGTVTLMTTLMLSSLAYLGLVVVAGVHQAWPAFVRRREWVHALGLGTLVFTLSTPFIVLAGPRSSTAYGERVAVTEALAQAGAAQRAVAAFHTRHRRFPADAAEAGFAVQVDNPSSAVGRLSLQEGGAVAIDFVSRRYARLDGRRLVLSPHVADMQLAAWDCRGGDVPDDARPLACRRASVCTALGLD